MQNIEFKCELRDIMLARAKCGDIGAKRIGVIEQVDTYFRIADGRLKQREIPDEPTEWIYYHRADRVVPRMSHFTIYSDAEAKARWGLVNLQAWVTVRKCRELYLLRNVRIHLDEVASLGNFLEFEAQVSPKYDVQQCHAEVGKLREAFGPIVGEAISGSYADLMDRQLREAEL